MTLTLFTVSFRDNVMQVDLKLKEIIAFISDIKFVTSESVELRNSKKMCSTLNIQSENVSVEPCEYKRKFFCYSNKESNPTNVKKPTSHQPCPGNSLY